MRNLIAAIFLGLLPVALVSAKTATKPDSLEVRTETLDARVTSGRLVSLSQNGVTLKTKTGDAKIPLTDLAEIKFTNPTDPLTIPGRTVVMTAHGQYVTAAKLTADAGKVNFTNSALGGLTFAFSDVAEMYFPVPAQSAGDVVKKCRELELTRGEQDLVVVAQKNGTWLGIKGTCKSIDNTTLTFSWKKQDRIINRNTVRAVFLASTGASRSAKFSGLLTLRDGTSLRFASLTCEKAAFNLNLPGSEGAKIKITADSIAGVKFVSDRVMNLSDLKPQSVKQHGLLDTTMSWKANRSASGGAILLGKRNYSTGLGLHSFCELTYKLDANFKSLITIVGIDDLVRPAGDAKLTFLGDGKELTVPLRVTGKDKPQSLRVELTGVKTLIIRVDFGKDMLDVGDHVNLAGARLIK
ncbi:MAG: hypothetical protein GY794_14315 [bacterium]|nr:hypothetical protein [bacterium]